MDYIHIYTGVESNSFSNASTDVRKALAELIENGTAYDVILHFYEEGDVESTTRLIAAYKTDDTAEPYTIVYFSHFVSTIASESFGIED